LDPNNYIIKEYENNSDNDLEHTIFAGNFYINNVIYSLIVSPSNISIKDGNFSLVCKFNTIICPILVKLKRTFLYIYNKNNILLRYNLENISKNNNILLNNNSIASFYINEKQNNDKEDNEILSPEIIAEDLQISAMDITKDMIIYSLWDQNKVFIHNLKVKKVQILTEYEEDVFVSSIAFIKNEGIKFLFIALSNGKMLFYKIKSKNIKFIIFI
jgi:hypothetical protein